MEKIRVLNMSGKPESGNLFEKCPENPVNVSVNIISMQQMKYLLSFHLILDFVCMVVR